VATRKLTLETAPDSIDVPTFISLGIVGRNKAYEIFRRDDFPWYSIAGKKRVNKDDLKDWLAKLAETHAAI
jgi:hypothetical protein